MTSAIRGTGRAVRTFLFPEVAYTGSVEEKIGLLVPAYAHWIDYRGPPFAEESFYRHPNGSVEIAFVDRGKLSTAAAVYALRLREEGLEFVLRVRSQSHLTNGTREKLEELANKGYAIRKGTTPDGPAEITRVFKPHDNRLLLKTAAKTLEQCYAELQPVCDAIRAQARRCTARRIRAQSATSLSPA